MGVAIVVGHGGHPSFKESFWIPIKSEVSPMWCPPPKNEIPPSIEKSSPVPRNGSWKRIQNIEYYHQYLYFTY